MSDEAMALIEDEAGSQRPLRLEKLPMYAEAIALIEFCCRQAAASARDVFARTGDPKYKRLADELTALIDEYDSAKAEEAVR